MYLEDWLRSLLLSNGTRLSNRKWGETRRRLFLECNCSNSSSFVQRWRNNNNRFWYFPPANRRVLKEIKVMRPEGRTRLKRREGQDETSGYIEWVGADVNKFLLLLRGVPQLAIDRSEWLRTSSIVRDYTSLSNRDGDYPLITQTACENSQIHILRATNTAGLKGD